MKKIRILFIGVGEDATTSKPPLSIFDFINSNPEKKVVSSGINGGTALMHGQGDSSDDITHEHITSAMQDGAKFIQSIQTAQPIQPRTVNNIQSNQQGIQLSDSSGNQTKQEREPLEPKEIAPKSMQPLLNGLLHINDEVTGEGRTYKDNPNYISKPGSLKINIVDTRNIDAITGKAIQDKYRLGGRPDIDYVKQLVKSSLDKGVDPYTLMAINLQESGFLHDDVGLLEAWNGIESKTDQYASFLKQKLQNAKSLGVTDEAKQIQFWNGYANHVNYPKSYGVEPYVENGKTYYDFKDNPLYGKRIIDIRDNILKNNKDIVNIVNDVREKAAAAKLLKSSSQAKAANAVVNQIK